MCTIGPIYYGSPAVLRGAIPSRTHGTHKKRLPGQYFAIFINTKQLVLFTVVPRNTIVVIRVACHPWGRLVISKERSTIVQAHMRQPTNDAGGAYPGS